MPLRQSDESACREPETVRAHRARQTSPSALQTLKPDVHLSHVPRRDPRLPSRAIGELQTFLPEQIAVAQPSNGAGCYQVPAVLQLQPQKCLPRDALGERRQQRENLFPRAASDDLLPVVLRDLFPAAGDRRDATHRCESSAEAEIQLRQKSCPDVLSQ